MLFDELEKHYRSVYSPQEFGKIFEEICCWFLQNAPAYRGKFDGVWRWPELNYGPDTGIDIVARCHNGDLWAIQAKAYQGRLGKSEADSFLSASNTNIFRHRLIMSTTDQLSNNARDMIRRQHLKVDLVLRKDLRSAVLDWSVWVNRGDWPKRIILPPPQLPLTLSLNEKQILAWADEHYKRAGRWPTTSSGHVQQAEGENWSAIDAALRKGSRGLSGGLSLAKLLNLHRGVRNIGKLPPLTEEQILAWADDHYKRTGPWPTAMSGPVNQAQEENWRAIDAALRKGSRGFSGGSSLANLLNRHRGVRHKTKPPRLTEDLILKWADEHFSRTGTWPTQASGPVHGVPGETWRAINTALSKGIRGLSGGTSLPKLLGLKRGRKSRVTQPKLKEADIFRWACAHKERTGRWPTSSDKALLPETPNETWRRIDQALRRGSRGLPGGSGLADLLKRHGGVVHNLARQPFSVDIVIKWADVHHQRTKSWPSVRSGQIHECPEETWAKVDKALREKLRGLPKDCPDSLAKLLHKFRNVRSSGNVPKLKVPRILAWADEHYKRTGQWPTERSGRVKPVPEETWGAINAALRRGTRGLPGGSSLPKLLNRHRSVRNIGELPPLTEEQILGWANEHFRRTGTWPTPRSGIVKGTSEKWSTLDVALRHGCRGLASGSSIAKLKKKSSQAFE
jgi:hypothetical protein